MEQWDPRQRKTWTVVLFVGCVLLYSTRTSMSISSASISKELEWTKEQTGVVLSAFFAGYLLTQIVGGYIADRYGGDVIIFYSSLIWACATGAIPLAASLSSLGWSSLYGVIFARFITGVSQGVFFPSLSSLLTKKVGLSHRSSVFSLSTSGTDAGSVLSGMAGSVFLDIVGWRSVFVAFAVISWMWLTWLYNLRTLPKSSELNMSDEKDEDGAETIHKAPQPKLPFIRLFCRIPVWALLIGHFGADMCYFTLLSWLPTYFHDTFPNSKGWLFNVIPWICSFSTSILSGYFADHLLKKGFSIGAIRKICVIIALGGASVFSLLLNKVATFPQALTCMSLIIGLLGFNTCGMLQNPQDLAPQHAGTLFGVMNTVGSMPAIIGVYATGYVLDHEGDWSLIFRMTSITAAVACAAFVICGSSKEIKE